MADNALLSHLPVARRLWRHEHPLHEENHVDIQPAAVGPSKTSALPGNRGCESMTSAFTRCRDWLGASAVAIAPRVRHRLTWGAWSVVLMTSLLAVVCGVFATHRVAQERAILADQIEDAERAARPAGLVSESPIDFASNLPPATDSERVVGELQRSAVAARVSLTTLSVTSQHAAATSLGRTDLDLTLRGTYPGIKQVLADLLGRFDTATVSSLRLHQEPGATSAEAQVLLSVWSRQVGP